MANTIRARLASLTAVLALLGAFLIPGPAAAGKTQPWKFAPEGISTDRFQAVTEPETLEVEAHDGITLHTEVYRPNTKKVPGWKTPVILIHSPYFNDPTYAPFGEEYDDFVEYFTPKGYTVVLADVRGTGNSGGCLEQDGINQQKDFRTLVDFFGAKKWSNGKVGSYGASYDGETQNAGAIWAPKHLATIVPTAAISGLYQDAYFDGVPFKLNGIDNAAYYARDNQIPTSDPTRISERPWCQPDNFRYAADSSGDMSPYWKEREFRLRVDKVRASVLFVQGFADSDVTPINIDDWYDELPTFKRAILGQWAHAYPDSSHTWKRTDWRATVHAWFDHELLGLDTGIQEWPAVQVQDENGIWRAASSFAGLGKEKGFPLGKGTIGKPGKGDDFWAFGEDSTGIWESKRLDSKLHLSGQAIFDGVISLTEDDAHFSMVVEEVKKTGEVEMLTQGWLSARHRHSLMKPKSVPAFEPVRYRIRTYPFDKMLDKGSRIRLRMTGSDDQTLPAGNGYEAIVSVNGASRLILPIVRNMCGLSVESARGNQGIPGCPSALRRRFS